MVRKMMPTIITGTDVVTYHGFAPPMFGAWTQMLLGAPPYKYPIGGPRIIYNLDRLVHSITSLIWVQVFLYPADLSELYNKRNFLSI